jgi:acyl-coenzyme A thioesterase PaaI-like protein
MDRYVAEDLSPEEIDAQAAVWGPLAEAVRGLVDATIRSEVDAEEAAAVRAEVEALTARLRARQVEGSYGVRIAPDGSRSRAWGNTVVGLRNPVAPPLQMHHSSEGRAWADFTLGAAYEGPPGLVHGGVSALVLDQVLGEAAGAGGTPGMTGTLTIRYRRPTRLGPLHADAQVDRTDGWKTHVVGSISDAEGVTVEAEAVFVVPTWAREAVGRMRAFE